VSKQADAERRPLLLICIIFSGGFRSWNDFSAVKDEVINPIWQIAVVALL